MTGEPTEAGETIPRPSTIDGRLIADYVQEESARLRARPPDLSFPPSEYADRLTRLCNAMTTAGIDLMVVSAPDSICWLHGHESRWYRAQSPTAWPPTQCTAVHAPSGGMVHFDMSHHEDLIRLKSVCDDLCLTDAMDLETSLGAIVRELSARRWLGGTAALEMWSSIPNRVVSETVQSALEGRGCRVVDGTLLIRRLRRTKTAAEIRVIEEAAAICDAGLRALERSLRPGMTELEAWAALVSGMAEAGGEPAAIHESVVAGPIAIGHAYSSTRVLAPGDYVCADPCGVRHRYHANIERCYVLADEVPAPLAKIAQLEAEAFAILVETAKPGVPVREVNLALRHHFEDAGVWGLHAWNGGYELGLSFPPDWVGEWLFTIDESETDDVIEAGMVTNYESIVLLPMIDTIVYDQAGARTLSTLPLTIIPVGA